MSDGMTQATERERRNTGDATDRALIARWRSGDERAATELVERHSDALARFIASMGERHEIEEIVQDTFVRAFSSLESFRGDSSLRTWLLSIARNLFRDRLRSAQKKRNVVAIQEDHAVTEYDALDRTVADETERRLLNAVDSLTPTQREVFTLRVGEGLSYKEIAGIVGSTEGAARVHYHNAMRDIKELLDE